MQASRGESKRALPSGGVPVLTFDLERIWLNIRPFWGWPCEEGKREEGKKGSERAEGGGGKEGGKSSMPPTMQHMGERGAGRSFLDGTAGARSAGGQGGWAPLGGTVGGSPGKKKWIFVPKGLFSSGETTAEARPPCAPRRAAGSRGTTAGARRTGMGSTGGGEGGSSFFPPSRRESNVPPGCRTTSTRQSSRCG